MPNIKKFLLLKFIQDQIDNNIGKKTDKIDAMEFFIHISLK